MIEILGYESESEVLQLNVQTDIYVEPQERRDILKEIGNGNTFHRTEVKWRGKDGSTIIVRVAGRQLETFKGGHTVYEAFIQDITEQRVMEQQFQQAQKMEAIGRLAGGVAHDFNNLLMIIRGCAELLDHHKSQPDKFGAYLKQIKDATSIAASVVQRLLMFNRKQSPQ